jgi:hypothetical protein
LQPRSAHLDGTAYIVLPLLFPAEKTPFTPLLARRFLSYNFLPTRHDDDLYRKPRSTKAGQRSSPLLAQKLTGVLLLTKRYCEDRSLAHAGATPCAWC